MNGEIPWTVVSFSAIFIGAIMAVDFSYFSGFNGSYRDILSTIARYGVEFLGWVVVTAICLGPVILL